MRRRDQEKQEPKLDLGWLGVGGRHENDPTTTATLKLVESVPCEPDHKKAAHFVSYFLGGDPLAGNEACAQEADPDSCTAGWLLSVWGVLSV